MSAIFTLSCGIIASTRRLSSWTSVMSRVIDIYGGNGTYFSRGGRICAVDKFRVRELILKRTGDRQAMRIFRQV